MRIIVKKYISILIILSFLTLSLTGCISSQNIDDLAYVVALGIDVGETDTLKVSFQIGIPSSSSSGRF